MASEGPRFNRDEDPAVVRVARLRRRRDLMLPTLVLVAAVALVGFLVGYRVGPGPAAQASPTGAGQTSPASRTAPGSSPTLSQADATFCTGPCVSEFLDSFSPATIVSGLPGGGDCTIHDFSSTAAGSDKIVRSWTINCPLGVGARPDFINALIAAILPLIPNQIEAGWSTDEFGSAVALVPYTDGDYSGTITVTADSAPPGYEIVVTIVEGAGP